MSNINVRSFVAGILKIDDSYDDVPRECLTAINLGYCNDSIIAGGPALFDAWYNIDDSDQAFVDGLVDNSYAVSILPPAQGDRDNLETILSAIHTIEKYMSNTGKQIYAEYDEQTIKVLAHLYRDVDVRYASILIVIYMLTVNCEAGHARFNAARNVMSRLSFNSSNLLIENAIGLIKKQDCDAFAQACSTIANSNIPHTAAGIPRMLVWSNDVFFEQLVSYSANATGLPADVSVNFIVDALTTNDQLMTTPYSSGLHPCWAYALVNSIDTLDNYSIFSSAFRFPSSNDMTQIVKTMTDSTNSFQYAYDVIIAASKLTDANNTKVANAMNKSVTRPSEASTWILMCNTLKQLLTDDYKSIRGLEIDEAFVKTFTDEEVSKTFVIASDDLFDRFNFDNVDINSMYKTFSFYGLPSCYSTLDDKDVTFIGKFAYVYFTLFKRGLTLIDEVVPKLRSMVNKWSSPQPIRQIFMQHIINTVERSNLDVMTVLVDGIVDVLQTNVARLCALMEDSNNIPSISYAAQYHFYGASVVSSVVNGLQALFKLNNTTFTKAFQSEEVLKDLSNVNFPLNLPFIKLTVIPKLEGGAVVKLPKRRPTYSGGLAPALATYNSEIVRTQVAFNTKFVVLYKNLLGAISAVKRNDVVKCDIPKVLQMCYKLQEVALESSSGMLSISGCTPNDYSESYLKEVNSTIHLATSLRYDNIVNMLKPIKELVTYSRSKVNAALTAYTTASKFSGEAIGVSIAKLEKLEPKLTIDSINEARSAIIRMIAYTDTVALTNEMGRLKEELTKYSESANSRLTMIDEYIKNNTEKANFKINKRESENPGIDATMVTSQKNYVISEMSSLREFYVFLNDVTDTFFTKNRVDAMNRATLNEAMLKKIDNARYTFIYNRAGNPTLDLTIRRLVDEVNRAENCQWIKLAQNIRMFYEHSQYLDYFRSLYRELGIDDSEFKWDKFKDVIYNYLAYSSICSVWDETDKKWTYTISTPKDNSYNEFDDVLYNAVISAIMSPVMVMIEEYRCALMPRTKTIPAASAVLRGGDIYDTTIATPVIDAEIVLEAVPLYIITVMLGQFYYQFFTSNLGTPESNNESLSIALASITTPLHPIFDIIRRNKQTTSEIDAKTIPIAWNFSDNDLKILIRCLNGVWSNATGSSDQKLSYCVEQVMADFNSAIIIVNQISRNEMSIKDRTSKPKLTSSDIFSKGVGELINVISEKMIKAHVITGYSRDVLEKQFDDYMKQNLKVVAATPENSRFNAFKSILQTKVDKVTGMNSDYYRFMEGCMMPVIHTINRYSRIYYYIYGNVSFYRWEAILNLFDDTLNTAKRVTDNVDEQALVNIARNILIEANVINDMNVLRNEILVDMLSGDANMSEETHRFLNTTWDITKPETYPQHLKEYNISYYNDEAVWRMKAIFPGLNVDDTTINFVQEYQRNFIDHMRHHIHVLSVYPDLEDEQRAKIKTIIVDWETQMADTMERLTSVPKLARSKNWKPSVVGRLFVPTNDSIPAFTNEKTFVPQITIGDKNTPFSPYRSVPYSGGTDVIHVITAYDSWMNGYIDKGNACGPAEFYSDGDGDDERKGGRIVNVKMHNTVVDYIIYMVASCDSQSHCLPSELFNAMDNMSGLGWFTKRALTKSSHGQTILCYSTDVYGHHRFIKNLVTCNIMNRSSILTATPQDITSNDMWGAALQAVIPVCINLLSTTISLIDDTVPYINGLTESDNNSEANVTYKDVLNGMLQALAQYYATLHVSPVLLNCIGDIETYKTTIQYVPDTKKAYKCATIGHQLPFTQCTDHHTWMTFDKMSVKDFIAIEWSHKNFYGSSIAVDIVDSGDSFKWTKEFLNDKLSSSSEFADSFNESLRMLAFDVGASIYIPRDSNIKRRELIKSITQKCPGASTKKLSQLINYGSEVLNAPPYVAARTDKVSMKHPDGTKLTTLSAGMDEIEQDIKDFVNSRNIVTSVPTKYTDYIMNLMTSWLRALRTEVQSLPKASGVTVTTDVDHYYTDYNEMLMHLITWRYNKNLTDYSPHQIVEALDENINNQSILRPRDQDADNTITPSFIARRLCIEIDNKYKRVFNNTHSSSGYHIHTEFIDYAKKVYNINGNVCINPFNTHEMVAILIIKACSAGYINVKEVNSIVNQLAAKDGIKAIDANKVIIAFNERQTVMQKPYVVSTDLTTGTISEDPKCLATSRIQNGVLADNCALWSSVDIKGLIVDVQVLAYSEDSGMVVLRTDKETPEDVKNNMMEVMSSVGMGGLLITKKFKEVGTIDIVAPVMAMRSSHGLQNTELFDNLYASSSPILEELSKLPKYDNGVCNKIAYTDYRNAAYSDAMFMTTPRLIDYVINVNRDESKVGKMNSYIDIVKLAVEVKSQHMEDANLNGKEFRTRMLQHDNSIESAKGKLGLTGGAIWDPPAYRLFDSIGNMYMTINLLYADDQTDAANLSFNSIGSHVAPGVAALFNPHVGVSSVTKFLNLEPLYRMPQTVAYFTTTTEEHRRRLHYTNLTTFMKYNDECNSIKFRNKHETESVMTLLYPTDSLSHDMYESITGNKLGNQGIDALWPALFFRFKVSPTQMFAIHRSLCFASILYASAVFKVAVKSLGEAVNTLTISDKLQSSRRVHKKFYQKFISNYTQIKNNRSIEGFRQVDLSNVNYTDWRIKEELPSVANSENQLATYVNPLYAAAVKILTRMSLDKDRIEWLDDRSIKDPNNLHVYNSLRAMKTRTGELDIAGMTEKYVSAPQPLIAKQARLVPHVGYSILPAGIVKPVKCMTEYVTDLETDVGGVVDDVSNSVFELTRPYSINSNYFNKALNMCNGSLNTYIADKLFVSKIMSNISSLDIDCFYLFNLIEFARFETKYYDVDANVSRTYADVTTLAPFSEDKY